MLVDYAAVTDLLSTIGGLMTGSILVFFVIRFALLFYRKIYEPDAPPKFPEIAHENQPRPKAVVITTCPYCGTPTRKTDGNCKQCGGPLWRTTTK